MYLEFPKVGKAIDIIRSTEIDVEKNQLYPDLGWPFTPQPQVIPLFCHIRGFGPSRLVRALFNLLMEVYSWIPSSGRYMAMPEEDIHAEFNNKIGGNSDE